MRPRRQGRALAGRGGTGRSGSCWRPGFVCLTAGGDDRVADVRLDLDPGVGDPAAQAALDPLPQVIAQPGVARQARQPGLGGALDHRRVPAQLPQHGNGLRGLRGLAAGGDERLHDRVEGVVDDVPEQRRERREPAGSRGRPTGPGSWRGTSAYRRGHAPASRREEKLQSGGGPGRIAADDSIPVSKRGCPPVMRVP